MKTINILIVQKNFKKSTETKCYTYKNNFKQPQNKNHKNKKKIKKNYN